MRATWTKKVLGIGLLSLLVGCGTGGYVGAGDVVVKGVAEPIEACVSLPIEIVGSNFLSEHGEVVTVRFEATAGTPFLGGTSAIVEVEGRATSNTTIELLSPETVGQTTATITVILPGGAQGSSTVGQAEITGGVLGPPLAQDDDYEAVGNVLLEIDVEDGVLGNDEPGACRPEEEPDKAGGAPSPRQVAMTVTNFDDTSALGGQVQVNADGSFSYDPPLGVEGLDSFSYEMSDGFGASTATVEILVDEMVWFIDDMASPGGDGRFSAPFDGLGAFRAVQGAPGDENPGEDDFIFVYHGTGNPYGGGIELLNRQLLIGEGVEFTVGGMPIVPEGEPPLLTNTGVVPPAHLPASTESLPCIRLADDNAVWGLIVDAPSGVGILGLDVEDGVNVNRVTVRDTGSDGIFLAGACTGTFTFGTETSVTGAGGACVRIDGYGAGFGGRLYYYGTIEQATGTAVDIDNTAPASEVHFTDGTIEAQGGDFTNTCIDIANASGIVEFTSPTTITGSPFVGVYALNSSGTFYFEDVTITTSDGGQSASGVELDSNAGATLTFHDLNVTMAGDQTAVAGGVPLRVVGGGQTPNLTTAQVISTTLVVTGDSSLSVADGEQVAILMGDPTLPLDLDVTFVDLTSTRNPQAGGMMIRECTGALEVTGTFLVEDATLWGVSIADSSCDVTLSVVDISGSTSTTSGTGIDVESCTGTVAVNGGTIDDMGAHGVVVDDGIVALNDVAISNVTDAVRLNSLLTSGTSTLSMDDCSCTNVSDDVVELNGTVVLSGTGNAASSFGTLCENNATSVTGSIDFGASGTCP